MESFVFTLRHSPRTGRYLDGTPRPYYVWCIYKNDAFSAHIEFGEDVEKEEAEAVLSFLENNFSALK